MKKLKNKNIWNETLKLQISNSKGKINENFKKKKVVNNKKIERI